ncbi:MAG: sigma-70 family RNA polymerase sigma factor [Hyphomicrobiales bacterium]
MAARLRRERAAEAKRGRMTRAEERRLLAKAKGGDARALARLLDALSEPVYRFGLGFCRDPDDAEDLAQDVLLSVTRSLPGLRGDAALTTYAYTAARNACIRRRRRPAGAPDRIESLEARAERGDGSGEPADPGGDPHRGLERRELAEAVRDAIAALPAPQREVVLLRDVEGLSAREAGAVLRIGERVLKARLHRGRLALRRALEAHVVPDGGRSRPREECPETALYFSRFLEGELTPALCARLSSHVAACPRCLRVCRSMRETLGACRRLRRAPATRARRAARRSLRSAVGSGRGAKA